MQVPHMPRALEKITALLIRTSVWHTVKTCPDEKILRNARRPLMLTETLSTVIP